MRVVCISDTHCQHSRVKIPAGDVLVHTGDFSACGNERELDGFVKWMAKLPHQHKVVVAGNHDRFVQRSPLKALEYFENAGIFYLQDASVSIDDIEFYGSPWQPAFMNWAFNLDTPEELKEMWDRIPGSTDVLLTHTPPYGQHDLVETPGSPNNGEHVGCRELTKAIARIRPTVHVFGHIHEGYGWSWDDGVYYVNAATCTARYRPTNLPIVFDLTRDGDGNVSCEMVTNY